MNMTATEMIVMRGIQDDMDMMEEYINVTHPSLPNSRIPFNEYLMHWNDAKEQGNLFKLFGGKTIISKKVTYEKSYHELIDDMNEHEMNRLTVSIQGKLDDIALNIYVKIFGVNEDYAPRFVRNAHSYNARIYSRNNIENIDYCPTWRELSFNQFHLSLHDFFDIMGIFKSQIWQYETWLNNKLTWLYNERTGEYKHPVFSFPNYNKKYRLTLEQKPVRALTTFIHYIREYIGDPVNNTALSLYLDDLETLVEELRLFVSMVNNQRRISGTLSISIHPFDYMTMSEPENGWTSCMEWCECGGGEYHAGTLEMMTSPCVVVAYLEAKDKIHPCDISFTWNKKKWRELFIVDRDFISGIKGYPFHNGNLEKQVFEMLNDLAKENWGITYNVNNIQNNRYNCCSVNGKTITFYTHFMYNDYEYNCPNMIFNIDVDGKVLENYRESSDIDLTYFYGDKCFCIQCGKERNVDHDDEREDRINCEHCSDDIRCSHCGEWINIYDAVRLENGCYVCDECASELEKCASCGKLSFSDDSDEVFIRWRCYNTFFSNPRLFYIAVCHDCYTKLKEAGALSLDRICKIDEAIWQMVKKEYKKRYDNIDNIKLVDVEWVGEGEAPSCIDQRS